MRNLMLLMVRKYIMLIYIFARDVINILVNIWVMLQNNKDMNKLPEGVKNYLIDLDGTVCDDIPNEEAYKMATAKVYPGALETLNKWYDEGHIITFFTSRTEEHREMTETWLKEHGFKYHGMVMNKPRFGNYHWIDNHIVRATRYNGVWSDLVEKEMKIEVFNE
jgi:hypothetical protein